MTKARWIVAGPCYADGWWLVQNRAAVIPELTTKWFRRRAAARAYRDALKHGRWRRATRIAKEAA